MMKSITIVITVAVLSSTALSQDLQSADTPVGRPASMSDSTDRVAEHFSTLAQMWMQAYNTDDSTTLSALYTPDAEYISSHVHGLVLHGRDKVIANFHQGVQSGGHIDSVSLLSVQLSCDLATLLCKYEATNSGQKAVGRNVLVVKKAGGKWLITLHMTVV